MKTLDETIRNAVEIEAAVLAAMRPLEDEIYSLRRRLESALGQVAQLQSRCAKLEKAKPASHRVSKTSTKRGIVLERCGGKCFYCTIPLALDEATIDHFIPLSKGGRNNSENLVSACFDCNNRKGSRYPMEWEVNRYLEVFGFPFTPVAQRSAKTWTRPNPPVSGHLTVRPFSQSNLTA